MEQGFDKEVHSLLRRTRGRAHERGAVENGGGAEPRAHLDADELGAFAEGALPSAARVAAASHLADCDDCRGILVGLVRAAGVESELEKSAVEASSLPASKATPSFRGWLDALFAPRVLRFVAPLLAVCLVGAVAFVALRSSRSGESQLARQTAPNTAPAPVQITKPEEGLTAADAPQSESTGTTGGQAAPGEQKKDAAADSKGAAPVAPAPLLADAAPAPSAEPPREAASESAPAPSGPASAAGTAAAPPPPSVSERTVQELPARPQPKSADENEAAKAKGGNASTQAPDEIRVESGRNAQAQNRAGQTNNVFEPQSPDGSRGQKRAGAARGTLGEEDSPEAGKDRAARRNARSESRSRRDEDKEELRAEERTAAGHRFRREGGAWVDVNYRPSMSQTGVRRGTDAYRALVADVPQVGRAAEQLSGEFIIVVSGRAYRVRP